jgi:hypothetical protein
MNEVAGQQKSMEKLKQQRKGAYSFKPVPSCPGGRSQKHIHSNGRGDRLAILAVRLAHTSNKA